MIKLNKLLIEIGDIYSLSDLKNKGVEYKIESDSKFRFSVKFKYKGIEYGVFIGITKTPNVPSIIYGFHDKNGNFDAQTLTNDPNSYTIMPIVFGFIYRYIESHDIKSFNYETDSRRHNYYHAFLKRQFPKYHLSDKTNNVYTWSKIQS